jgi:surface antigen
MARKPASRLRPRVLARRLSLLVCLGSIAAVLAPGSAQAYFLRWEPTGSLFWSVNRSTILDVFQNGQCTQLAANRRPDIVRSIIKGFVNAELTHDGTAEVIPDLDARYWSAEARRVGLRTGHKPRRGALMVLQPGVLGAGSAGHIAYVLRVNRNRSFRIAQMHAPTMFQVSRMTLPAKVARLSGVSFVY